MKKFWKKIFGKKPTYAVISEYVNTSDYEITSCLEPEIVCITTDKKKALEEAKWECEHRTADMVGWWDVSRMQMHENEGCFTYHYRIDNQIIVGTMVVEIADSAI